MFLETWNFKDHKKISLTFSVSLSVSLLDPQDYVLDTFTQTYKDSLTC